MLKVENLCVSFGENLVLDGVSLDVNDGEIVAISGHNGAGKSTLFNVIAGSLPALSGHIYINSTQITHLPQIQRSILIARLLQDVTLGSVGSMTVAENLCLGLLKNKRAGLASGRRLFGTSILHDLLRSFDLGLEEKLETPLNKLSGGQRQIIAFVMAIAKKPKLLLLDEPTAALDPVSADRLMICVRHYIAEYQIPALLITHDPDIAKRYATHNFRIGQVHDGNRDQVDGLATRATPANIHEKRGSDE